MRTKEHRSSLLLLIYKHGHVSKRLPASSKTILIHMPAALPTKRCSRRECNAICGVHTCNCSSSRRGGGTTDEQRVSTLVATLEQKMDAYERILSKHKYLAGDVCSFPSSPLRPSRSFSRTLLWPIYSISLTEIWLRRCAFKSLSTAAAADQTPSWGMKH
jgi:hypothetical protein